MEKALNYIVEDNCIRISHKEIYDIPTKDDHFAVFNDDELVYALYFTGFKYGTIINGELNSLKCSLCKKLSKNYKWLEILNSNVIFCDDCLLYKESKTNHIHLCKSSELFLWAYIDIIESTDDKLIYHWNIKQSISNFNYINIIKYNNYTKGCICKLCLNNLYIKFGTCNQCYNYSLNKFHKETWIKFNIFNLCDHDELLLDIKCNIGIILFNLLKI